eukprot:TRINITY_DN964_c0_g5_i4.p1 TRINITY_DN964_c0_g5~~TRINITY_DN964_c0_g5_i4.p1  ORF type:complete len:397 (-),score=101.87 TRINITY_DN964_c0_g5_i4:1073-2263(-)
MSSGQTGLLTRLRGNSVATNPLHLLKTGDTPGKQFASLPNMPVCSPPAQATEKDMKLGSTPLSLVKSIAVKNVDISARFFAQYLYKSSDFILCVLEAISKNSVTKANEVVQAVLALTEAFNQNVSLDVIRQTIKQEVQRTSEDPTTLFRGDNLSSKLLRTYTKMIGEPLLKTLVEPIQYIVNDTTPFEVDPAKLPPSQENTSIESNQQTLRSYVQLVFDRIIGFVPQLPIQVKKIAQYLKEEVTLKYPKIESSSNNAIAGYIFLRFVCPAITSPEAWGILEHPPTQEGRRKLMLVSKILQTLASGASIKEEYLSFATSFLTENLPLLRNFFSALLEEDDKEFYRSPIPMLDISTSMKTVLAAAAEIKPQILAFWLPTPPSKRRVLAWRYQRCFSCW